MLGGGLNLGSKKIQCSPHTKKEPERDQTPCPGYCAQNTSRFWIVGAFHYLPRPFGCDWFQPDAIRSIWELKGRCRVGFKSWGIAPARGRGDRSTFNTLQMMKTNSDTTAKLYIGLDVHKEKSAIALAEPGAHGETRSYGEVATTQIALERTIRKIAKARGVALPEVHICYEAGGCGMWIARMLVRLKVQCTVVSQNEYHGAGWIGADATCAPKGCDP